MEEGDTCRICRTGEEDDTPLYHPCKCSGSIAKVHQDCLIEWLQHSKKKSCELCNTELRFHKVYSPSMPVKLPTYLYIRRLLLKLLIAFRFMIRGCFVGTAWLAILPLGNLYIWRLHFWIVDALLWGIMGGEPPSTSSSLNANMTGIAYNQTSNHTSSKIVDTMSSITNSTMVTTISDSTKIVAGQTEIGRIPFPLLPLEKLIMRIINHAGYRRFFDTLAHDTFEGQILTCAVVVLFVALFLLREWCLQNMPQQVEGLAVQPPAAPQQPALPAPAPAPAPPPLLLEDVQPPQPNLRALRRARLAALQNAAVDGADALENLNQPPPLLGQPDVEGRPIPDEIRNLIEQHRQQRDEIDRIDGNADGEEDRNSDASDNIIFDEGQEEDSSNDDTSTDNHEPADDSGIANNDANVDPIARREEDDSDDDEEEDENPDEQEEGEAEERRQVIEREVGAEGNQPDPDPIRPPVQVNGIGGGENRNENGAPRELDLNDWDEGDGENGERLEDDLDGMMEAIGMRGPLINLVTNMTMMFVLCSFILTVFVALPYSMGRLFGVGYNFVKLFAFPIRMLRIVTDPIVDRLVDFIRRIFVFLWNSKKSQVSNSSFSSIHPKNAWKVWKSVSITSNPKVTVTSIPKETLRTAILSLINNLGRSAIRLFDRLEILFKKSDAMTHGRRSVDRAFCIGLGHFYWLVGLAIQHNMSHLYIRWNLKALKAFVDQQIVVLKVLGFIVLELMVFPLCCGILTDVSLHPLWKDVSISSRIVLFQTKPLSISFTLWSVGTLYMFALAQFVSHTRNLVRPGVLCFVRDAGDPNFHPIKDILERRSLEQLRKIGISGMIYSSILAVTLGLCTRMLALTTNGIVPLNWNVHQTFSSVGFEMVGMAVLLPIAVKAWFPGHWIKKAAKRWWIATAEALRISSYLIGGRYPSEEIHTPVWKCFVWWILDQLRIIGILRDETPEERLARLKFGPEPEHWGGFGRVPADDHAIMQSPLVIRTNFDGEPIDARGKEALKAQMEAIGKVTSSKKPEYTVVHLPNHFRARIITLIVALWFTLCTIFFTILLPPLIVGRSTIKMIRSDDEKTIKVHDGLAWVLGCCVFGVSHTIGSKAQKMYLKMRTSSNAPRRFAKHVRRFGQRCLLLVLFGVITSTGLGMVVEVYLNGLTRIFAGNSNMPDLSFFHVWSMGLMEQQLVFEIVRIRNGRQFRPNWEDAKFKTIAGNALGPMYVMLELQNGAWRKPRMMRIIKGGFLPAMILQCTALALPLFLCHFNSLHNASSVNNKKGEVNAAAQISLIYAICSSLIIFALLYQKIVERMNSWTDILKDEHFLISTELKNYTQETTQQSSSSAEGEQRATQQQQLQNGGDQIDRLNAEGPIPDALLRAN